MNKVDHYKKLKFTNLAEALKEWLAKEVSKPEDDKKSNTPTDKAG